MPLILLQKTLQYHEAFSIIKTLVNFKGPLNHANGQLGEGVELTKPLTFFIFIFYSGDLISSMLYQFFYGNLEYL